MLRMAAAATAAAGLWTVAGVLALTSNDGSRIGVLPPAWLLAGIMLGFAAVAAKQRRRAVALFAVALPILPWLPFPIPAAFLMWVRPLVTVVAAAAALGFAFQAVRRRAASWAFAPLDPRRAPLIVGILSVVLYAAAAVRVAPMIPGGDEPHYLIITQSLLYDFDLKIENNHAREDYRSYVDAGLRPDYIVRGTDGEIYSIHMPGLSVLVAPAFLVGGYPAVVAFMILLAALAGALLWRLAFMVTGDAGAAWFGWASIGLCLPMVFHSFTIYPDSAAVLPVLVGVLALLSANRRLVHDEARLWPWLGFGAALAVLPWLHARFALVAGGLGMFVALRLWSDRRRWRKLAAFFALPVLSAAGWFAFFEVIYGSPNPRAQYGGLLDAISSPSFITSGIGGLFLDQQFGIVPRAPVFLCALAGTVLMLRNSHRPGVSPTSLRRLAIEILLLVTPYLVSTTTMRMWWGGWSAPARFVVPLIPLFGLGAAMAWQRAERRPTRGVMLAALALSATISATVVWVDRGRLAYDVRQTDALWLEWAGPLANLGTGLPTFLRTSESQAWVQSLVWLTAVIGSWLLVRSSMGVGRSRLTVALALVGVYAAAGMGAISIAWRLNGSSGTRPLPAQLDLLYAVADGRGAAVAFDPLVRVPLPEIPARIVMELRQPAGRRPGDIVMAGPVPAGTYTVGPAPGARIGSGGPASGVQSRHIEIGVGRQFAPVWEIADGGSAIVSFPVNVSELLIRGYEPNEGVALRARSIVPTNSRVTNEVARRARRYRQTRVFFTDGGAYPEADAFWVRAATSAGVVIQPDELVAAITFHIRNAPVENTLAIESGRWRDELKLAPNEERQLSVPSSRASPATLVRLSTTSGFRPSDVDPSNRDRRYLGVWVKVVE